MIYRAWGRKIYGGNNGLGRIASVVEFTVAATVMGTLGKLGSDCPRGKIPSRASPRIQSTTSCTGSCAPASARSPAKLYRSTGRDAEAHAAATVVEGRTGRHLSPGALTCAKPGALCAGNG